MNRDRMEGRFDPAAGPKNKTGDAMHKIQG